MASSIGGLVLFFVHTGEFAIEKLIEALREDDSGGHLNQFRFMKNLIASLGYEVKMVRITERVVNTYYARIYLGKSGEDAIMSVDARPSDAINIAERCKVFFASRFILLVHNPLDDLRAGHGATVRVAGFTTRGRRFESRETMSVLNKGKAVYMETPPRTGPTMGGSSMHWAPIYVSKNIVFTDAIKITYGKWTGNNAKSSYDVFLDSAAEGPDKIAEELDLIMKMNLAASEERYTDAAEDSIHTSGPQAAARKGIISNRQQGNRRAGRRRKVSKGREGHGRLSHRLHSTGMFCTFALFGEWSRESRYIRPRWNEGKSSR
ncbi:hypothetical protein ACLOJK_018159 [Asimina triloba]